MYRQLRTGLAFCLLLAPSWSATAQLGFIIDPVNGAVPPGFTVSFTGSLQWAGVADVYLNGAQVQMNPVGFTLDPNPFLIGAPLSMSPGDIWTGDILDVTSADGVAPGEYTGLFTVYGGANPESQDELAAAPFTVSVASNVPEGGSLSLLLAGLSAVVGVHLVRGRTRRGTRRL